MAHSAQYWINKLKLAKHPEGGHYREIYRSNEFVHKKSLPGRYSSFRSFSTSIYFLLESNEFSAFHRLKSDEIWHFYEGSILTIYIILPNGKLSIVTMGQNPEKMSTCNLLFQKVVGLRQKFILIIHIHLLAVLFPPDLILMILNWGKEKR